MSLTHHTEYAQAPSALAFMGRAFLAPRRAGMTARVPEVSSTWRSHRVSGAAQETFLALTGLANHPLWPLLYPHVVGFRLQMTILTHAAFPLPIWGALQVRNILRLHRPFAAGERFDLHAEIAAQRILEKGAEIDLRSTARAGGEMLWQCVNTFFYRGRHGVPEVPPASVASPRVEAPIASRWNAPRGGRLRFGWLTGDYNGIHLSRLYARLFGFPGAFLHPGRVLGQCLARLPEPIAAAPVLLEAWLKGPVHYGAEVALRVQRSGGAVEFALHADDGALPAIVARLSAGG